MEKVTVTLKGIDWIVHKDGTISIPEKTTLCSRTKNGVLQTYSHTTKAQTISPYKTKSGYLEVCTTKNGKRIKATVHRLIGFAYVPGYEEGLSINHINGIKTDNRPENLEWVSLSENTKHQWRTGLTNNYGENSPQAKLTSKQVVYIRKLLQQGIPAYQLSVIAGVSDSIIYLIKDNKRWRSVNPFHCSCDKTCGLQNGR